MPDNEEERAWRMEFEAAGERQTHDTINARMIPIRASIVGPLPLLATRISAAAFGLDVRRVAQPWD
jgi:hypothetical protein